MSGVFHRVSYVPTLPLDALLTFLVPCLEFETNQDTCEWLKKIEGPVGVISVAGMYRTGKSYLLNRVLLNQSKGFDVGPTINACTKVSKINE